MLSAGNVPLYTYLWKLQLGLLPFRLLVGVFERSLLLGMRIPCRPIARLSFCYLHETAPMLHLQLLQLRLVGWGSASAPIQFQDIISDDSRVINLALSECNVSRIRPEFLQLIF